MKRMCKGFFILLMLIMLCSSAYSAETMGLYQVKANDDSSTYFDTVAWSYVIRGLFNVQINFGKQDTQKIDKKASAADRFNLILSRADYEKIFESEKELVNFEQNDNIWCRTISAKTIDGRRHVSIKFENAVDDEITSVFNRGTFQMILEKGNISRMRMKKEKKRFLGFGGYKTTFVGEARNISRTVAGLGLRDEGEMGRVTSNAAIDIALKDKTKESFREAIKADK